MIGEHHSWPKLRGLAKLKQSRDQATVYVLIASHTDKCRSKNHLMNNQVSRMTLFYEFAALITVQYLSFRRKILTYFTGWYSAEEIGSHGTGYTYQDSLMYVRLLER